MTTLAELLALLPDNATGAIDASDLRTIVAALWENDETLLGMINEINPGDPVVAGRWQVNPTAGLPSSQQVCPADGTLVTTSALRFSEVAQNLVDYTVALMAASELYAQQATNSANWIRWEVTGTPTDLGTVIEVPVTVVDQGGALSPVLWQSATFLITTGGP